MQAEYGQPKRKNPKLKKVPKAEEMERWNQEKWEIWAKIGMPERKPGKLHVTVLSKKVTSKSGFQRKNPEESVGQLQIFMFAVLLEPPWTNLTKMQVAENSHKIPDFYKQKSDEKLVYIPDFYKQKSDENFRELMILQLIFEYTPHDSKIAFYKNLLTNIYG